MAIDMPTQATKLTYEDLLQLPDEGKRYELLDGELFVMPSPSLRHQVVIGNLFAAIRAHVKERAIGVVLMAPLDIVLSPSDVLQPDLLFISNERRAVLGEANVSGAPDLAVEVLSPWSRRRDEVLKRERYEQAGVAEYWIVDPEVEDVKVLRRAATGLPFGRPELLTRHDGDALATPLLPELALPLDEVFAD